jgi:hypothetical protein
VTTSYGVFIDLQEEIVPGIAECIAFVPRNERWAAARNAFRQPMTKTH